MELKPLNRRADNTVTTVYKRFMEHFHQWDDNKMDDKEWESIRRGFEAQGKMLGNLVRVLGGVVGNPNEFKNACISFGILPEDFDEKLALPETTEEKEPE